MFCVFSALPAQAYTPEAEAVLEALREKAATGLVSPAAFAGFLEELEEQDGCQLWAKDPPGRFSEIRPEIEEVCPDLNHPGAHPGLWRARGSAMQSVQPRRLENRAVSLQGEITGSQGQASLSMRGRETYFRSVEFHQKGLSLQAGHLNSASGAMRLDFVAGKRFYTGWSGQSGITGYLGSPRAALDGLELVYHGQDWQIQCADAWNRLTLPGEGPDDQRRDAQLYLLGGRYQNMRVQIARQSFEPAGADPVSVFIGGATWQDAGKHWTVGLATARWSWIAGPVRQTKSSHPGLYGEVRLFENGNYRMKLRQASLAWSNPLQSQSGIERDTLNGQWIRTGRGEGGLDLQTQVPVWEIHKYRSEVSAGTDLDWSMKGPGLLAAQPRIALIQTLGDWTYSLGTGLRYKRAGRVAAEMDEESSGQGHILTWKNRQGLARLALTRQGPSYQGSYPEPLACSWEQSKPKSGLGKFRVEAFTGNIRQPSQYLRLAIRQEWFLGGEAALRNSLRLPWSGDQGWKGDLGYQLELTARI